MLKVIHISGNTQRISVSPDGMGFYGRPDQGADGRHRYATEADPSGFQWTTGFGCPLTPDGRWLLVTMADQNNVRSSI